MVSEQRRSTYAAAVSGVGESSQRSPSTPIDRSPARTNILQRNHAPQRSTESEEDENPLHLGNNDHSNIVLVTPLLAGSDNYGTWSISMRNALEVKNKWGIVDGSVDAPEETHRQYPAWRRCNIMVCSWICRSVHPSIAQTVMYMQKASDVWNDLKKRFSQRDPHRISILQSQIYELKQGNLSVNDYYTKCRGLWEQMNELRPLPMCKCTPKPKCSCNLMEEIRNERETDHIIRFLQGLTDEYHMLRSNILVLDPLPVCHGLQIPSG